MIVLSAELRRGMTVLVIDGAESREKMACEKTSRTRCCSAEISESLGPFRYGTPHCVQAGWRVSEVSCPPCEAWHAEPPAEKGPGTGRFHHRDIRSGGEAGDQRRGSGTMLARCGQNAARSSAANSSGSSHAAKWPPLSASWK